MSREDGTGAEVVGRRTVDEGIMVAGADHCQVVGVGGHVPHEIRKLQPRLPVPAKRDVRTHELGFPGRDIGEIEIARGEALGKVLSVVAGQGRLGIQGVHMAGASLEIDEDHIGAAGILVRRLGCERVQNRFPGPLGGGRPEEGFPLQQMDQRQGAEAHSPLAQELAS